MTLTITLNSKYNEAKAAMSAMNANETQSAIATLTTPISDSDVPEILCNADFFYAWFRYLHYRKNVWGEILSEETIKLQLEFLADEESGNKGDAVEILTTAIRNNTKSLYSTNQYTPKKRSQRYARRTSRAERSKKSEKVGDTVMVSIHSKKINGGEEIDRNESISGDSGERTDATELFPT